MSTLRKSESIDWHNLLLEFETFEPDDEFSQIDPILFVNSLIDPLPQFVAAFLEKKTHKAGDRHAAVRDLFVFLLEKRYGMRINLLYFAFEIFDDCTCLPQKVIDRTPLPHEDGIPRFKHRFDPDYQLNISVDSNGI